MKTSWSHFLGVIFIGGMACLALGCKASDGGKIAQFENPFKAFGKTDKEKGHGSEVAQGEKNHKPSLGAKPDITTPIGGYANDPVMTDAIQRDAQVLNSLPRSNQNPATSDPYQQNANAARQVSPYESAYGVPPHSYSQTAYGVQNNEQQVAMAANVFDAQPASYQPGNYGNQNNYGNNTAPANNQVSAAYDNIYQQMNTQNTPAATPSPYAGGYYAQPNPYAQPAQQQQTTQYAPYGAAPQNTAPQNTQNPYGVPEATSPYGYR